MQTKKYPNIILMFCMLLLPILTHAETCHTRIYDSNIHTLRTQYLQSLSQERPILSRPFLVLKNGIVEGTEDDNTLEISWDEMSHSIKQYTYTLLHLNEDMTISDRQTIEYLRGFTTADVTNYTPSVLTQQLYTHYSITFPNEDMQITQSGNYLLRIYEDGNPEHKAIDVCFSVVEPMVTIHADVKANTAIEFNGRFQQIDIDILTNNLHFGNSNELTTIVQQNGRRDNIVFAPKPSYIEHNKIRYVNHPSLIFEGGNEYRHFDTYSKYYAGYGVDKIRFHEDDYHALLNIDYPKGANAHDVSPTGSHYSHEYDSNGQYVVNAERTDEVDSEAEYMWVHWNLAMNKPLLEGNIYVGGDIFLNQFSSANRMNYDADNHCYYLSALVKQGGYDYQYLYIDSRKAKSAHLLNDLPSYSKGGSLQHTDGSHWETENEYTIYVFYHPASERYSRLVGIHTIHSK